MHEGAAREASNAQHVASLQQEASQRLTGLCQILATGAAYGLSAGVCESRQKQTLWAEAVVWGPSLLSVG